MDRRLRQHLHRRQQYAHRMGIREQWEDFKHEMGDMAQYVLIIVFILYLLAGIIYPFFRWIFEFWNYKDF